VIKYGTKGSIEKGGSALGALPLFYAGDKKEGEGVAKPWGKGFYNSRAWQDMRKSILLRDAYTCQMCGARASEVHHKEKLTAFNVSNPKVSLNQKLLVSLCHDCHTKITEHGERAKENYLQLPEGWSYGEDGQPQAPPVAK
jgi:hypothetical protein